MRKDKHFKRLSTKERIRKISDLHRFPWFLLWKSTLLSHEQILRLFWISLVFSFLRDIFQGDLKGTQFPPPDLHNLATKVERCWSRIFNSKKLSILYVLRSTLCHYVNGQMITLYIFFTELEIFQNTYLEHWNLWCVRYMWLKAIFSYVGPDLESNLLQPISTYT